jgi:SOS-response transcriptional repressor LexA
MKIIYEKLITAVRERFKTNEKMTQESFAALCGLTQGGLNKILTGERREPDNETVSKLVKGLGVPMTEFLTFEPGDNVDIAIQPRRYVPLISWVNAGRFKEAMDENPVGIGEPIPYEGTDPQAFALVINGDSMEDEFFAGDIIIVSPNAYCNSGDYCVVKIGDTVSLKKVIMKDEMAVLRPLNKKYEDIIITKDDKHFHIIGRVVFKQKRY